MFWGMSWGSDDTIVISNAYNGLKKIPARGGTPRQLTVPAEGVVHNAPFYLPEHNLVLYTALPPDQGQPEIRVLDTSTGSEKLLLQGTSAHYASSGHLLFERGGSLWAAPFNPVGWHIGEELMVVDEIKTHSPLGFPSYSVSQEGTLIYQPASEGPLLPEFAGPEVELVWVDRSGNEEIIGLAPNIYMGPRISPDGNLVAMSIFHPTRGIDIWIHDLNASVLSPLTFDGGYKSHLVWRGDGRSLAFVTNSLMAISGDLVVKDITGIGAATKIADMTLWPIAWSQDKKSLITQACIVDYPVRCNFSVVGTSKGANVESVGLTDVDEINPAISSDGKWMAYQSEESGEFQIYVVPFPSVQSGRWQISTEGGRAPQWSSDGSEIFFIGDSHMMSVPVDTSSSFRFDTPRPLFSLSDYHPGPGRSYSISPDNQQFLMLKPTDREEPTDHKIVVVLNFFEELERLFPKK